MKQITPFLIKSMAAGLMLTVATGAVAQDKKDEKQNIVVAVVDTTKIFQSAKAVKGLIRQRDAIVKRFQAEFAKENNRLRRAYANIDRQCAARSIQWCRRERGKLADQVQQIRRLGQIRRQQLTASWQNSMRKLLKEVTTVVKAMSIERGFTMVFVRRNSLIHYSPQFDITDEVIKRVDKSLPELKFEFPPKENTARRGRPRVPVTPRQPVVPVRPRNN